ncbi:MAG: hypothetical protein COC10_10485 [Sphingobium sp.]|nr:MAG: hypothetical protein COC10_10485 [Sphingobium sp.]
MRTDQALLWALGGGALLLLGLGGAAMMRRRRPDDADATTAAPGQLAPEPVVVRRAAPAPAMARPLVTADATLDAMVAAPPSADNPFMTRSKRLRRAKFLLAQREAAMQPPVAQRTVQPAPVPTHAADRSQTVYRFGADRQRQGFMKPRTR